MNTASSRVDFYLYSYMNSKLGPSDFLSPQGTILFERVGFPRDLEDATCIPKGPAGFAAGIFEPDEIIIEAQWYQPAQPISRTDFAAELAETVSIKGYFCHKRRPEPDVYPLTSILVDKQEVQWIGFVKKKVVYRRLGHEIALDLSDLPDDKTFTLSAEWDVDHVELRITWVDSDAVVIKSGWGLGYPWIPYTPPPEDSITRRKIRSEFGVTLVPTALSRAVWSTIKDTIQDTTTNGEPLQEVSAPRKAYLDEDDVYQTILEIIAEVQRIVWKTRPYAFWNKSDPKPEPESGFVLRGYFEAVCAYKNIMVVQEDPSRSGDIDFVFAGTTENYERVQVLLEIKNAHSDKLERGLTHQLPQYLQERFVGKGIYGVLWFKGRSFTEPNYASITACLSHLNAIKPAIVSTIVIFDVSFPVQASRL